MRWVGLIGRVGVLALLVVEPVAGGERETVTLRGETLQVWPVEDLVKRGFNVTSIPREENAAWVYIDAINRYANLPERLDSAFDYAYGKAWPQDGVVAANLADYLTLTENREALDLMHKASRMERHQMPHFGDPDSSVLSVLLPNLSSLRFLGKMAVADGRRLESQGKLDEAIERYTMTMRLGEQVAGDGGTVIESLVGIAVWALGDDALVDLVLRRELAASRLHALADELEKRADRAPGIERGLRSERAFGLGVVDEMCANPMAFPRSVASMENSGWLGGADQLGPADEQGWGQLTYRIGQLMLPDKAIKRHMSGYYDGVERRTREGEQKARFDEAKYLKERVPKWDAISRTMLPSLVRAIELGESIKARYAGTRAILALRAYARENDGQWPDSFDQVGDAKQAGFVDPFGGRPLVYRRSGNGWILYSLGPNLKDDGGRVGKRRDELDIVWTFPSPEPAPFVEEGGSE